MKFFFKFFGYSVLVFFALVFIYFIAAFCLSRITVGKERVEVGSIAIYIKTNGVHTDIIVPIKTIQMDWGKEIKFSNTTSNDTSMQYLGMGWGDRSFYLETPNWSDLKFKTAFKAAFALGKTAIHTTFYKNLQEDEGCKKVMLNSGQYSRLIVYLDNSFKKDTAGHVININTKANYNNDDAFYEAIGNYSIFKTCNTWANTGLKKCGQKACLWTPFDTGIFLKYK